MKKLKFPPKYGEKVIDIKGKGVFTVESVEANGKNVVCHGSYNDGRCQLHGTFSAIAKTAIKKAEDVLTAEFEEWSVDYSAPRLVTTQQEIANLLGISSQRAQVMVERGALPDPIQVRGTGEYKKRVWREDDVKKMAKFMNMNKYELLRYIADNIVGGSQS